MFKSKKREAFFETVQAFYDNHRTRLSPNLTTKLIDTLKGVKNGYKISYLAYQLYPYVIKELSSSTDNFNDLNTFKQYLEKIRWKYYAGLIFGLPFVSFR